jgi:signal transduction histidine kinase
MVLETWHRPVPEEATVESLARHRLRAVLHDLRQPLAAVFALAEAARSVPEVPPEARDCIDLLVEQAQEVASVAAAGLTDDGAAPDGSTGGHAGPDDDGPVDLNRVLDSVVDSFAVTWTGRLQRAGWLGRLPVAGDRVTLRRCLVNLIENATRAAGPDGTVAVTVQRTGASVRIVIDDDGPGFGRVPRRSGLGLDATRRAVEPLGGTLSTGLPSASGGARVALSFPLHRPAG